MKAFQFALEKEFDKVQTYIQSGNLIVYSTLDMKIIHDKIQGVLKEQFSIDCPIFILSNHDFVNVIKNNPFINEPINQLYVTISDKIVDESNINVFNSISEDKVKSIENYIYLNCIKGYGNTKLNNNFLEKKLNITATTRNWKTMLALQQMLK